MKRMVWAVAASAGLVVCVVGAAAVTLSHHAPATTTSPALTAVPANLHITNVTVTAARVRGESAVTMSIGNDTGGPISLMNVTSPVSSMNMLYYDTNMCQGNTAMTWLPNILISSHQVQLLGYRNQGVMLSRLQESLKVGQRVPLRIKYSDFSSARTITVDALVVAPPKGLHFLMSAMKM